MGRGPLFLLCCQETTEYKEISPLSNSFTKNVLTRIPSFPQLRRILQVGLVMAGFDGARRRGIPGFLRNELALGSFLKISPKLRILLAGRLSGMQALRLGHPMRRDGTHYEAQPYQHDAAASGAAMLSSAQAPQEPNDLRGRVRDGKVSLPPLHNPSESGGPPNPDPQTKRMGVAVVGLGHLALEQILPASDKPSTSGLLL